MYYITLTDKHGIVHYAHQIQIYMALTIKMDLLLCGFKENALKTDDVSIIYALYNSICKIWEEHNLYDIKVIKDDKE